MIVTEAREKAKEAGMNEHISKPLDINVLMDKIAQYC
jgi:CheY-like chemotaxis protein